MGLVWSQTPTSAIIYSSDTLTELFVQSSLGTKLLNLFGLDMARKPYLSGFFFFFFGVPLFHINVENMHEFDGMRCAISKMP